MRKQVFVSARKIKWRFSKGVLILFRLQATPFIINLIISDGTLLLAIKDHPGGDEG